MEIKSDYSLTKSFVTKEVTIYCDRDQIKINLIPLSTFYNDEQWVMFYSIINLPIKKLREQLGIKKELDLCEIINLILMELGKYKEYFRVYCAVYYSLNKIIHNFSVDLSTKTIYSNEIVIDRDVLDYILYVIKLSSGERIEEPRQFASEAERAFYLAQKEYEEQIKNIRQKGEGGSQDAMMKILLSITYAFPSFTFEYLFEQTLAQIRWLQKYAAEATSYEVNKEIFAAGNMKKGSKLSFFIK